MGFVNALPTDTYADGTLYIAGKPFAIATLNDLVVHNPTITYDLEDGTLLSVENIKRNSSYDWAKQRRYRYHSGCIHRKTSAEGISAHCAETIGPNRKTNAICAGCGEDHGILTMREHFSIQPKGINRFEFRWCKVQFVPTVQISGEELIKLGKVGSETTLGNLKPS